MGLAAQQSFESFVCGGLNGGAQEICVPGTQKSERATVPQQLDVRENHGLVNHDKATAVPVPQVPLPLTAALVEINPDNGTTT